MLLKNVPPSYSASNLETLLKKNVITVINITINITIYYIGFRRETYTWRRNNRSVIINETPAIGGNQ